MRKIKCIPIAVVLALMAWVGESAAAAQVGFPPTNDGVASAQGPIDDVEENPVDEGPSNEEPAEEGSAEEDMRGDELPDFGKLTREDIAVRDGLVAEQESLLNVYRCMFGVDTGAVPGGCVNGEPAQGPTRPGVFEGIPTRRDIEVRDQLIANQEALLNVYRCQFNVDTQIVPGGC